MSWTLEHVRERLALAGDEARSADGSAADGGSAAHPSQASRGEEPAAGAAQAAVALVLRFAPEMEILLIRRSEHDGDPWSGHMAFPGGRRDAGDRDALETAIRETAEEVGLDLRRDADHLGELDTLPAMARGRRLDLVIVPHVFVARRSPELVLSDEVEEALWAPVAPLVEGKADTVRPYRYEGYDLELPAYQVREHVVWGLTYRMLGMLFERLAPKS
jgi:8-oxo-dGTP pyrophosphatase MutT (NUDIX family)